MKILFIASRFPYPPLKGDQARVFNTLKHLHSRHEIYFVCTYETQPSNEELSKVKKMTKEMHLFSRSKLEGLSNLLLAPLSLLPFQVMFFHSREARAKVKEILRREKIDVVFCQLARTAPYVEGENDVAKVLDFQDAYSLNMYRRFKSERGLVRWVAAIEWLLLKIYEKRLLGNFQLTTVVSQRDREALGDQGIRIVPIGMVPQRSRQKRVKNSLIFSGNLRYFPNRDAITWFTREVYPLVKRQISDIQLMIVGATPPQDVLALGQDPTVTVAANVASIKPYLERASLSIAPLRSGSGTQFKIIEAMAVGTPVLATDHAQAGLDFISKDSLATAPADKHNFAAAVVALLGDPDKLARLGEAGFEEVRRHYSWPKVTKQLEEILIEAKENFRPPSLKARIYWQILPVALLVTVLALGALVRFYQIDSNVYMGGDEGRDARVTTQMLNTGKPILQGPPTSITTDIGRVYYGPGYYYAVAPAFILTGGNPASAYMVTALLGLLATLLIYLVAREFFGTGVGLISSLVYATSLYIVGFERWAWSPNWIPALSLLSLYGLIKLARGKEWGVYLLAVGFGLGWQMHYTFLFLLPLVAIVWWRFGITISRRAAALALAIFFIISSPLIVNEIKYGFPNSKVFFYYLFSQTKPYLPLTQKIATVWQGALNQIISVLGNLGIISWSILLLSSSALVWELLWHKRTLAGYTLFLWPVLTVAPILIFYNGDIPFDFRFVMPLIPWTVLMTGLAISKFSRPTILSVVMLVLVALLVVTNVNRWGLPSGRFFSRPVTGLADMIKAVTYIQKQSQGQPIAFDYHPSGGSYPDGYLYIMDWKGVRIGPDARKTFSLYEIAPNGIDGQRFGPIFVSERSN